MKLLQRLLAGVMLLLVCLTTMIILDLESRMNSNLSSRGVPDQGPFRHRNLQRMTNGSREAFGQLSQGGNESESRKVLQPVPIVVDKYDDLQDLVKKLRNVSKKFQRKKRWSPTVWELLGQEITVNTSDWDRFHLLMSSDELYKAHDKRVDWLLQMASTLPIQHTEVKEGGTQTKLTFFFEGGGRVLFKPMRYSRETQTNMNQFYFSDFERHNAEIAAFHLDRLLGFRRAMPTVGRVVNITSDIYQKCNNEKFRGTFYHSPDDNNCFVGLCSQLCLVQHAICGNPDKLEGSLAVYLPSGNMVPRRTWEHPWRRSYNRHKRAAWQDDPHYCDGVRNRSPYTSGRLLLDLMDMAIFDFLIGNLDRHHYETYVMFGNNTIPLHLDQGRAFGRPFQDYMDALAPLYHCCLIRFSTLYTLLRFQIGSVPLSEAMRQSMAHDPVSPVLWEPHLQALDRRLPLVLKEVRKCIEKAHSPFDVIIDDYH